MADWIITIPKKTNWDEYVAEVNAADLRGEACLYRLPNKVGVQKGDRIFVTHNNKVKGWQKAYNCSRLAGFQCTTTSMFFPEGWYVERRGPFIGVDGPEVKGFRGIRSYKCP